MLTLVVDDDDDDDDDNLYSANIYPCCTANSLRLSDYNHRFGCFHFCFFVQCQFHPRVEAVARKRPKSFCQKCRLQFTSKTKSKRADLVVQA